jgi:hypothetical protein
MLLLKMERFEVNVGSKFRHILLPGFLRQKPCPLLPPQIRRILIRTHHQPYNQIRFNSTATVSEKDIWLVVAAKPRNGEVHATVRALNNISSFRSVASRMSGFCCLSTVFEGVSIIIPTSVPWLEAEHGKSGGLQRTGQSCKTIDNRIRSRYHCGY